MKVKELIVELQKQDPEMEVFIQQGEEFDYATAHTVKLKELSDFNNDEEEITAVVIEYY